MKALLLGCLVFSATTWSAAAWAQDPGMMAAQAAQQAGDMAMQANQQAIQDMQTAAQTSQQAMLDAQNAAQNQPPAVAMTRAPKFSASSRFVAAGTMVRIKSPTHYAVIYYTTNGWTPTFASRRYTGPIRLTHDMTLQAIAVAPNMVHSLITRAEYKVPGGSSQAAKPTVLNTDGVLRSGTRLRLATDAQIDSKTAQVGDKFPLRLEQDIMAGDKVVIPKGTAVEALVTQADAASHAGVAGNISFTVQSLVSNGITIPLDGGETLEGENHLKRTIGLMMIPVAGPAALLQHGEQAVIKPGMTLNAVVAADTPLMPADTQ